MNDGEKQIEQQKEIPREMERLDDGVCGLKEIIITLGGAFSTVTSPIKPKGEPDPAAVKQNPTLDRTPSCDLATKLQILGDQVVEMRLCLLSIINRSQV